MKTILSFILGLVAIVTINAANVEVNSGEKATVVNSATSLQGKVIDKLTGESLAGVVIKLEGTSKTIYTDFDGNFEISDLNPGEYKISTSLISYKNEKISVNTKSKSVSLQIEPLDK